MPGSHRRPVTPCIAVDVIIEMSDQRIVLIERKNEPLGWAIPGGFVDVGETLEHAAVREAREETSLDVELIELLGIYSDPRRDSRGHTISPVYIGRGSGTPRAQDDAANLALCDPRQPPGKLAFDHRQILDDYLHYKATGQRPKPGR